MKILLILICVTFVPMQFVQAKDKCDPFLKDLKKIQSKLKHGYSVKKGEKLKAQEKQARRIWWLCKNNKLDKRYFKKTKIKAK